MAVKTEMIKIQGNKTTFGGYLAVPEGGSGKGIIVVQEIFGVNTHIQDVTRRFAEAGYTALAPDLFWQAEPGFTCGYSPEEIEKARDLMGKVSLDQAADDIAASVKALHARPECEGDQWGVVGFCWGGLMTYLVSCRQEPTCAVSYYGGRTASFIGEAANINNPITFHYGEQDAGIPMDQVEAVRNAVAGKPNTEVFTYPEANHGFHCDQRGSYHQASAQVAWQRTLDFFGKHLA